MTRFYSLLLGTVAVFTALPAYADIHGYKAATLFTSGLTTEKAATRLTTRGEAEVRGREAEGEAPRGMDGPGDDDGRGRGMDDGPNHDVGDDHGSGGHGADDGPDHDLNDDHGGDRDDSSSDDSSSDDSNDDNSGSGSDDDNSGSDDDNSGSGGGDDDSGGDDHGSDHD